MKNLVVLVLVFISVFAKAQEVKEGQKVSVEKNLNSMQLGLLSLSFQNESRLERKTTLRSEIGFSTGNSTVNHSDGTKETSFLIFPYINVEPRWYYSIDRRSRLEKKTANNSSNYVSLLTTFYSSRTTLVNTKDFEAAPFIAIIPEYGFRRSVGKHFFSECSAGVGYKHSFFDNSLNYTYDANEVVIDIQYKFGYIF
jgi:hypothetical protein